MTETATFDGIRLRSDSLEQTSGEANQTHNPNPAEGKKKEAVDAHPTEGKSEDPTEGKKEDPTEGKHKDFTEGMNEDPTEAKVAADPTVGKVDKCIKGMKNEDHPIEEESSPTTMPPSADDCEDSGSMPLRLREDIFQSSPSPSPPASPSPLASPSPPPTRPVTPGDTPPDSDSESDMTEEEFRGNFPTLGIHFT